MDANAQRIFDAHELDRLVRLRRAEDTRTREDRGIVYSFRRDEHGNLRLDDFDTSSLPFASKSLYTNREN